MSTIPPAPAWWGGPNAAVRSRRRAQLVLWGGALLVAVGFGGLARIRILQDQAEPLPVEEVKEMGDARDLSGDPRPSGMAESYSMHRRPVEPGVEPR